MKLKTNDSVKTIKTIDWHKKQAIKSERFSQNIAKQLGLTTEDLTNLYGKKRVH